MRYALITVAVTLILAAGCNRGELDAVRGQLESTRGELDAARGQLESTRGELDAARGQLESTRGELDAARGQLESTRGELDAARGQLESTRGELNAVRGQLESTRGELSTAKGNAIEAAALLRILGALFAAAEANPNNPILRAQDYQHFSAVEHLTVGCLNTWETILNTDPYTLSEEEAVIMAGRGIVCLIDDVIGKLE